MLLLAGLVGPLVAQENENAPQAPAAKVKPTAAPAYAGISPAVVTELARRGVTSKDVPPGVGVMVAFVDPKGPSMGILAEDDILVRLDDQVLVNPEQFRALISMRKPGDVVKIVAVREDEVVNVDLKLGSRNAPVSAAPKAKKLSAPKADVKPADEPAPAQAPQAVVPPRMGITINGQTFEFNQDPMQGFPPEIIQQFNEMRQRGMAVPQAPQLAEAVPEKESAPAPQAPALQSKSKSFSFSFGNGASVSSNSVASDRDGTVAIDERDGKKHAVIKDASGKVLFDGDVTSDEARAKMNPKVRDRLKLVETNSFKIQSAPVEETNSDESVLPKKKNNPKDGA